MRNFLIAALLSVVAAPALAQPHIPHWGVTGTFTPHWTGFDSFYEGKPVDVTGTDFRFGIVRGKPAGGEWGVSLVHKRISDDSTIGEFRLRCEGQECLPEGDQYGFDGASMTGMMAHTLLPFATIRRTVQFGLLLGVGVAGVSGDSVTTSRTLSYFAYGDGRVIFVRDASGLALQETTLTTGKAKDLFKTTPVLLGDAQLAVSVNLGERFKLRASSGVSLPGYNPVSISVVYFFDR